MITKCSVSEVNLSGVWVLNLLYAELVNCLGSGIDEAKLVYFSFLEAELG